MNDKFKNTEKNLLQILDFLCQSNTTKQDWLTLTTQLDLQPNGYDGEIEKEGLISYLIKVNHPSIYKMINSVSSPYFAGFILQGPSHSVQTNYSIVQMAVDYDNLEFLQHLIKINFVIKTPEILCSIWDGISRIKTPNKNNLNNILKCLTQITEQSLQFYKKINDPAQLNFLTHLETVQKEGKAKNVQVSLSDAFIFHPNKEFPVYINKVIQNLLHWQGFSETNIQIIEFFTHNSNYKYNHNTFENLCLSFCFEQAKYIDEQKSLSPFIKDPANLKPRDDTDNKFIIEELQDHIKKFSSSAPRLFFDNLIHEDKPKALKKIIQSLFEYFNWDIVQKTFMDFKTNPKKSEMASNIFFMAAFLEVEPSKINFNQSFEEVIYKLTLFPPEVLKEYLNTHQIDMHKSLEWSNHWQENLQKVFLSIWDIHEIRNEISVNLLKEHKQFHTIGCQRIMQNLLCLIQYSFANTQVVIQALEENWQSQQKTYTKVRNEYKELAKTFDAEIEKIILKLKQEQKLQRTIPKL